MSDRDAIADAPNTRPLSQNRDFRLLAVSQGISSIGDLVAVTALPLLVLELTGSGVAMGVVLAIQALTDFAFGLFAGALADRSDRKRMMVVADVGRAFLTALIPISAIAGGRRWPSSSRSPGRSASSGRCSGPATSRRCRTSSAGSISRGRTASSSRSTPRR